MDLPHMEKFGAGKLQEMYQGLVPVKITPIKGYTTITNPETSG
ncbi:hypothetical protein ES706_03579 [subsurface metagenome]